MSDFDLYLELNLLSVSGDQISSKLNWDENLLSIHSFLPTYSRYLLLQVPINRYCLIPNAIHTRDMATIETSSITR